MGNKQAFPVRKAPVRSLDRPARGGRQQQYETGYQQYSSPHSILCFFQNSLAPGISLKPSRNRLWVTCGRQVGRFRRGGRRRRLDETVQCVARVLRNCRGPPTTASLPGNHSLDSVRNGWRPKRKAITPTSSGVRRQAKVPSRAMASSTTMIPRFEQLNPKRQPIWNYTPRFIRCVQRWGPAQKERRKLLVPLGKHFKNRKLLPPPHRASPSAASRPRRPSRPGR